MICDLDLWFDLWFAHHWWSAVGMILSSVCDAVHRVWAMHPAAKVSEEVNRKSPLATRFYNFQFFAPTHTHQTLQLWNCGHWCQLANTLKQRTQTSRRNFHIYSSLLHGYSRQCSTIGSLSATAGPLVNSVYIECIGSRALSFSGPLLSLSVEICLSVCVSATLRSNISETKGATG